jgi:imidazoleglycerol-phosphate dehydratase
MKIAILLYEGFSAMDVAAMQEPLRLAALQQQQTDYFPKLVARETPLIDRSGRVVHADSTPEDLSDFDLLLLPGCSLQAMEEQLKQTDWITWLKSANPQAILASADAEARLWSAAGRKPLDWFAGDPVSPSLYTAQHGEVLAMTLRIIQRLYPQKTPAEMQDLFNQSAQLDRTAQMERKTAETSIIAKINLDGSGRHHLNSGIPFLDHMLQQIAVHGMVDLSIQADGDLAVDIHHTMEDIGIVLGKLILQALGDRKGIRRCASARVPMDESLAEVTLDFSGRAYCIFECTWQQAEVGGIPVSLFRHFFESLSVQAACNLHIQVPYGLDDHHQIEAIFKAFARALDAAAQRDPRRLQQIPSSKGVL